MNRRVTNQDRAEQLCASFGLRDMKVVAAAPAPHDEWLSPDRFAARCEVADLEGHHVGALITDEAGGQRAVQRG